MSYISGCEGGSHINKEHIDISVSCLFSFSFNFINVYTSLSIFFGIQKKIHALSNAVCGP
jgi:hypothetical protein